MEDVSLLSNYTKVFSYICGKKINHSIEEYMDGLNIENPYE